MCAETTPIPAWIIELAHALYTRGVPVIGWNFFPAYKDGVIQIAGDIELEIRENWSMVDIRYVSRRSCTGKLKRISTLQAFEISEGTVLRLVNLAMDRMA